MAKTQIDPNCTKPYKYNPRYFPHHDFTIPDKRMAKALHKCDKNRTYEEQMAEVEEILGRKFGKFSAKAKKKTKILKPCLLEQLSVKIVSPFLVSAARSSLICVI